MLNKYLELSSFSEIFTLLRMNNDNIDSKFEIKYRKWGYFRDKVAPPFTAHWVHEGIAGTIVNIVAITINHKLILSDKWREVFKTNLITCLTLTPNKQIKNFSFFIRFITDLLSIMNIQKKKHISNLILKWKGKYFE